MSDTTSPPSVHLHPLSPSSSMSSTDSAPQSEPTSDEQPDLGAFTTVLRAWTYLQPPPRIPVQIHSPTTSTTTTFQPDQSMADSDVQSSSHALPPSSSVRPSSSSVLHEESTVCSHALPTTSSFTRPPSSSVHEESTVWNHAPIASYLYSGTPSIERITDEDENSVASTEGGRTVEINSELSFDGHSSSVHSQPPYLDAALPIPLEPSLLLPPSDSSDLFSHLRNISNQLLPSSYSSTLSLLSYQIPETPPISESDLLVVAQQLSSAAVSTATNSTSLKAQKSSDVNSMTTPTSGPPPAIPALPIQQQRQHRTVLIHPPTQTISDDASVSHLSLPPPSDSPIPTNIHSRSNPYAYLSQPQPLASLPQARPPRSGIEVSTSLTRGECGGGLGTIVVDDLRTPDQTPESFVADWKRGGRTGGFRPVDDDDCEEVGEKGSRAYGYGLGFGFGRVQQKHVSGYTSNYEGSQSSFRARKPSEVRGRSTRLEPQNEDNEDSGFNSDVPAHRYDDEDKDKDWDEEDDDYPFPDHRRHRGRFHSHTPRYYGRTYTPPRGVLPTQPPQQLQSMGHIQNSPEVLRGATYDHIQPLVQPQSYTDSDQCSRHTDLDSHPDPYPRPHARPHAQYRDIDVYSSHSPTSSIPSSSPYSHIEPSPIQRDYVLIQPQTQSMQLNLQSLSQQPQLHSQTQAQTSKPVSYLSSQNQGSLSTTTTTTSLPPVAVPISVSVPLSVIPMSIPPSTSAVSIFPSVMSAPAPSSYSNVYQGQGVVTSQDHTDFDAPLLILSSTSSTKHDPPLSSSSSSSSFALLSRMTEKVSKPDEAGATTIPGRSDKVEKTSRGSVDLEEHEIISVSISGRNSSAGGDVGGSGLGVSPGQTLTKYPSMKQQQQQPERRQVELQFQHSDEETRPHVESDSDGSKDGRSTTTVGPSVLEVITTTSVIAAASATTATATTTTADSLPPNPNPIPLSIPIPIPIPNPDPDRDPKFHPRAYNQPKHSHSQSDSHYHPHPSYPGFHSDSYVAHIEDTTDSDLDLDLNDGLDDSVGGDVGVGISADIVQRVGLGGGGGGGDGLLPSLGYLDEALSFIAAERVRWSAAREGGCASNTSPGASRNAGAGVGNGGGGKRTEDWKVLDYDIDTPKRKRRRKRPPRSQQQQQPVLSSVKPGLLEVLPPNAALSSASHTADKDGGGPSTSMSPVKKARSSSWSPAKKKSGSNNKGKEKEFLVAPSQPPLDSARVPSAILVQDGLVLRSGHGGLLSVKGQGLGKQDEDGGRTPTNGSGVAEDVFRPVNTASMNLSGKRKKTGKKERVKEREMVRKDLLIGEQGVVGKVTNPGRAVDERELEEDEGDNDEDDEDDAVSHGDLSVEGDSSLNDLSILQPPPHSRRQLRRKKGKDIAHIHSRAGIAGGGAYKSTPGSPKRWQFDDIAVDRENGGHGYESLGDEDVGDHTGGDGGVPDIAPKKRNPKKRVKGLVRVRSVPQLRSDAEEPTLYAAEETVTVTPGKLKPKKVKSKAAATTTTSTIVPALNGRGGVGGVDLPDMNQPQTKRGRLITLAKKLRQFFPEQRQELRRLTLRFEKQGSEPRGKSKKAFLTSGSGSAGGGVDQVTAKSPPSVSVPGVGKSKRGSHRKTGSESASADIDHEDGDGGDGDGRPEIEEEELDPRGRPPKKSDVLIHVFIDHSNILIGLLSHLRRLPVSRAGSKETKRGLPLPTIPAKATPTISMSHVTTPELTFAAVKSTTTRPLFNPNASGGTGNTSSSSIPIAVPDDYHHLIPLPSFATVSRSLPSGSVLNEYLAEKDDGLQIEEKNGHSDSFEYYQGDEEDLDDLGQITSLAEVRKPKEKEKKNSKHLWHTALVLLLERGRSVTRRVVVTSSPLYQSMDGIERLGYELRVYIRVPDLGNGMDRDRRRDRSGSFSGGGSKSVQSSPSASNGTVSFSGLPIPTKDKRQMLGHVRRVSGSTSAESGGGGGGSGNASGGASKIHPYYGIANNTPPHGKIKYREQGVDELLQLKLHQALAATDNVPEGSTIVLATGDGNMGQFNEEGFLGPVRTALRRGWKVELYAWEDGLSRAWRREFGENTEWGRKGMFRIIGMEQFAGSLVEVIEQ